MKCGRKIYQAVAAADDQDREVRKLRNGDLRSLLRYVLKDALYQSSEPAGTIAGHATVAAMRRWLVKPAKGKGTL